MAPYGGLTHSLPLLGKIFQWFMSDHLKIEGFLFRLTSFLVLACQNTDRNFPGEKFVSATSTQRPGETEVEPGVDLRIHQSEGFLRLALLQPGRA